MNRSGTNPYLQGVFWHPDGRISYDPHGNAPLQQSTLEQAQAWYAQQGGNVSANYSNIFGNNNSVTQSNSNNYYNYYNPVQNATQNNVQQAPAQQPAYTAPAQPVVAPAGTSNPANTSLYSPWTAAAIGNPSAASVSGAFSPISTAALSGAVGSVAGTPLARYSQTSPTYITNRQEAVQVQQAEKEAALREFDRLYASPGSSLNPTQVANQRTYLAAHWDQLIGTTNQSQFFGGYSYVPTNAVQINPIVSGYGTMNNGGYGTVPTTQVQIQPTGGAYGGAYANPAYSPTPAYQTYGGSGGYSGVSTVPSATVYNSSGWAATNPIYSTQYPGTNTQYAIAR